MLVDSHCHIHWPDYKLGSDEAYTSALENGVKKMICVGTDVQDSENAVKFAAAHENAWASVGLHPHDAKKGEEALKMVDYLATQPKVVAIGECGLDFHYNNSPKEAQIEALRRQIKIAKNHDLPVIFHVRDAYDDFWPVFDEFENVRGVLHSFTDTEENMQKALDRGLYIGVNGISTFTKIEAQKQMYKNIPLQKLLIETDAPFLTPVPMRGKVNEPAYVKLVAEFLAKIKQKALEEINDSTSRNAEKLFFKTI